MKNETRENEEVQDAQAKRALGLMNKELAGQHGVAIPAIIHKDRDNGRPIYLGTFIGAELKGLGMNIQFSKELILWAPQIGWRSILGQPKSDGSRPMEFECDQLYIGEGRNMKKLEEILQYYWKIVE